MSFITVEKLEEDSFKTRLQRYWAAHNERFGKDPDAHRNPNTVVGFLSKEKLHEMYSNFNVNNGMLLIDCGLGIISNGEVMFFADEGAYGHGILPSDFHSCTIKLHHRYGEGQEYPNVEAIIERFGKDERHINSIEELVEYCNNRIKAYT